MARRLQRCDSEGKVTMQHIRLISTLALASFLLMPLAAQADAQANAPAHGKRPAAVQPHQGLRTVKHKAEAPAHAAPHSKAPTGKARR